MARYTGLFIVAVPLEDFRPLLLELIEACNLDIIYDTGDYIMAREVPGQIPFGKLVTVEFLIDKPANVEDEVRMNLVMKNEELPLHFENHCRQVFDFLSEAIAENRYWQLLETAVS
ncbi:hypothetical protein [Phormidium sp. CCY1219]|jgi:hypothetical protein|uniref:hypothetical protein n=1 Tax=Phormidium sp. CCY1219 TaxID=2886104 RepID=UPI002D1F11E4|nr:hypothetical protein [Phormidium sp. CCY1219]MEB3826467.1 hypothetical protein [Phormidium sp. CCY1219]